jgi:hypothetical protein
MDLETGAPGKLHDPDRNLRRRHVNIAHRFVEERIAHCPAGDPRFAPIGGQGGEQPLEARIVKPVGTSETGNLDR